MNPYLNPASDQDAALWRLAQRRAKFKAHLFTYLVVNAGLWALWALTDRTMRPLPWPAFVSGFWGISLLINALGVYGTFGRVDLVQREYERLKRQQ